MGDALPGQSAPGLGRGSIFGVGGAGQVSHNPVSRERSSAASKSGILRVARDPAWMFNCYRTRR